MITTCDQCGKLIEIELWKVKRYKHHFCNRKCYYNYKVVNNWFSTPKSNLIQNKLSVWAEIKRRCKYMDLKDKDMKQLGRLLACSKGKDYKEILKEYMKRKESKK